MGNSMPSMAADATAAATAVAERCEVMANEHEHVAYRSRKRASAVTFLSIAHISLDFPSSFSLPTSITLTLFRRLHVHSPFPYSSFVSHTHFARPKIVPRVMTMVSTDLFVLFGFCSLPSLASLLRSPIFFQIFLFVFFWFVSVAVVVGRGWFSFCFFCHTAN